MELDILAANFPGNVLIIDDERNILNLFKRDFFKTNLNVFTASTLNEAIKVVDEHMIDIVICDLKMQVVDGIEVLKKLKEDHPEIHRILLSGTTEKPEVIKALTNGTASAFVAKPWDRDVLVNQISHIIKTRKELKKNDLLELIQNMGELPALPKIYNDFMEAYNNDASIREISDIIHKDVVLTTEVLRIANSAFFGSIEINDLKQAVLHLGLKYVKDIVFTVSITKQMSWSHSQMLELETIIAHSIKVNKYLGQYFNIKYEEALDNKFNSAGVLHDLGKIILLQFYPERFQEIKALQQTGEFPDFHKAEVKLGYGGCSHAEIGAFFLDYWNFPELNIDMSLYHHSPEYAPDYIQKFMHGLSYINVFVNTFSNVSDFKKLDSFELDDLDSEQKENLFFKMFDEN